MGYKLITSWSVMSPIRDSAVRVTLIGQTDDDWHRLEICACDEEGALSGPSYPLRAGHLPRNVSEIGFSKDGLVLVALEHDGSVIVWRQSENGKFDTVGKVLRIGSPICGLRIWDSGESFSLHEHGKGIRTFLLPKRRELKSYVSAKVA